MSPLVPLAMFGWIPLVIYLFWKFPAQRAVTISFVAAWLFLPEAIYPVPGLPDYTKMSATCYGILLATALFNSNRFSEFRPGWIDVPITVWCLSPIFSSISNGLGLYDGFSTSLAQSVSWGLPYFLGRIYLGNWLGLRQLAVAIFVGGLAYIPLCVFELRFSPQLHRLVYGFHAFSDFAQSIRYGGYRPTVFLQHGLAVGAWMMAATLAGIWLWKSGAVKKFMGIPMKQLVPALLITFILCKSTGAYLLFILGLAILFSGKRFRTPILLTLIPFLVGLYLYFAVTGAITPERREVYMTNLTKVLNEERIGSLEFRLKNEEILAEKARERIIVGWGGWGRSRVYDETGKDISVTDSLWIIAFGNNGLVGLISVTLAMLLPALIFPFTRYSSQLWAYPAIAPVIALTVIVTLYMVDCVLNAMVNPVYILALGGISGLLLDHPPIPKPRPHQSIPHPPKREYALQSQD